MKLKSQQDVDSVNERFNHFHDGFIKQVKVISGNEFLTDSPWQTQRHFASNEDELLATGLYFFEEKTIELEVHHYNYDWPNQPRQRAIGIKAPAAQFSEDLLSFIGMEIFGLEFLMAENGISCVLSWVDTSLFDPKQTIVIKSKEDLTQTVLFTATEMEIVETHWGAN